MRSEFSGQSKIEQQKAELIFDYARTYVDNPALYLGILCKPQSFACLFTQALSYSLAILNS